MNTRILAAFAAIAIGVVAGQARATAYSTDYSDLWWNPAESGWGVQFVQQANVIFATMFVYDAQGNATWYTATLDPLDGTLWRGDLYLTHGSWFGGSFSPGNTGYRAVGTMSANFTTPTRATLAYGVDGTNVSKSIQRQTLRNESFDGVYGGVMRLTAAGCAGIPDGLSYGIVGAEIVQGQNSMTVDMLLAMENAMFSCVYNGDYSQGGRFGQSQGTYQCPGGGAGTFTLSEMAVQKWTLTASFARRGSDGCSLTGTLSGIRE